MLDEMETGSAEREREIVTNVARYGKQLGRVNDAFNVVISLLLSQVEASCLEPDERRALEDSSRMFKEIAEAKGEHPAPTEKGLDLFLGDIRDLKDRDPQTYDTMLKKLREFSEAERPE